VNVLSEKIKIRKEGEDKEEKYVEATLTMEETSKRIFQR
jgi:hypothetical protein